MVDQSLAVPLHDEVRPLLEQPLASTTPETWASLARRWRIAVQSFLGLPSDLWFPALIFLLGIAADYCEGAFFTVAYTKIGSEFQEKYNGALLKICYSTVTAAMRPIWSILCNHLDWYGPLVAAFVFFICALAFGSFGTSMTDIMISRGVTAVGAAGMVFIPNLVFNKFVPPRKLSLWVFAQAPANLLGQFIGSHQAEFDLVDSSSLRLLYWRQIYVPTFCAFAITLWVLLVRPTPTMKSDTPVSENPGSEAHVSSDSSNRHSPSAAGILCITCLVVAVAGFCVILNLLGELPERVSIFYWLALLFMILGGSGGFLFLYRSLTPADNLFPNALAKDVQRDVVGIFLAAFAKDAGISNFTFAIPWFCQHALLPNPWIFRSLWISVAVGTFITAAYFESFKRVKPWLGLSVLICTCSSFCLCVYLSWMSEKPTRAMMLVPLILSMTLGVGYGMMQGALHPLLIAAIKGHLERQAMLYAGFHLMSTLGDLVATAMSNWLLRQTASALMRRNLLLMFDPKRVDEIVEHCLKTDDCTANLKPEAREAVRKSFLNASAKVSTIQIAAYLFLGVIVWRVISEDELEDNSKAEESIHRESMD